MSGIPWGNPKITVEKIPAPKISDSMWGNPKITVEDIPDIPMAVTQKRNVRKPKRPFDTGIIIDLNVENEKGVIKSGGKEYQIRFDCGFHGTSNHHTLKVGDKVRFRHMKTNYGLDVKDVSYVSSGYARELKKVGVIISCLGKGIFLIESERKEYQTISKRTCHYDTFPDHTPKIGDRIRFMPVVDNNCFYAENISYMVGYYKKLADYTESYKKHNKGKYRNNETEDFIHALVKKYGISEEDVLHDLELRGIHLYKEPEPKQLKLCDWGKQAVKQTNMALKKEEYQVQNPDINSSSQVPIINEKDVVEDNIENSTKDHSESKTILKKTAVIVATIIIELILWGTITYIIRTVFDTIPTLILAVCLMMSYILLLINKVGISDVIVYSVLYAVIEGGIYYVCMYYRSEEETNLAVLAGALLLVLIAKIYKKM